ncbi:hypothetical protein KDK95_05940 [Actinospica sp. MGRD01-02]|uniref:Tox-REase-2 domain-containing protein n=1 Tax=Actinospica acidithermotolerans TaxID=2828514 RepID=A0A941E7E6_9ACTN|nr:restriction endonuclease fold toxin-2 domain-containing protein [Actinospica acidithermotolerans]MBR7825842.1 hypothetical protein [Actinospica acidithermotolerans]
MNHIAMPFDGGGGYAVDPDLVFSASTGFLATKEFVFEIATGLAGDLSGTGGMAGGDKAGHAFAASYQPAAQSVIAGIDKAGQGMAAISSRLLTMAVNYLETENQISKSLGSSIDVSSGLSPDTSECEPTGAAAKLPEAVGEGQHSSIPVIGRFWPQGDTGRLRSAAQVWASAAHLIDEAQTNAGQHALPVIYECSGAAFTAFQKYAATVYTPNPHGGTDLSPSLPLLENLSAACRLLGKQCESYADAIDHCKHVIEGLATAAGLVTVGGILLSVFTFGGSDEGAGVADGAIASEAGAAAEALEAGEASSAAVAAVQEAEQIVAQLAAKLVVTGGIVAATALAGSTSASAATGSGSTGAGATGTAAGGGGLVGPIPPANPPAYPLYTAAQQKAAAAWIQTMPQRPANYGTAADQAYQVRVAGEPERNLTGADGSNVWADGYRPADGAIIDAKNVRNLGCSPRTLQGLQENSFATTMLTAKDSSELGRYQQAIANPNNHAQFLELDTNDPETVGYWQYLLAEQHVTSNVRYVP